MGRGREALHPHFCRGRQHPLCDLSFWREDTALGCGGVAKRRSGHYCVLLCKSFTESGEIIALYPRSQAKREGIVKDRGTISDREYVLSVGVDGFLHMNTEAGLRFRSINMKNFVPSPTLIPTSMCLHFTSDILFIGVGEWIIIANMKSIIGKEKMEIIAAIYKVGEIRGINNCISVSQRTTGISDMLDAHSNIPLLIGGIDGRCTIMYIDTKTLRPKEHYVFTFEAILAAEKLNRFELNTTGFSSLQDSTIFTVTNNDIILWNVEMEVRIIMRIDAEGRFSTGEFSNDGDILLFAYGYDWSKGIDGLKNGKANLQAMRFARKALNIFS